MKRSLLLSLLPALAAACATPRAPGPEVRVPDGRLAAIMVQPVYDAAEHEVTCKVYHHAFAPAGTLLTKPDGGLFPHHRGLFLGWNKTRWHERGFDFWHMNKGESQRFVGYGDPRELDLPAGAQVASIDWLSKEGECVLHERRGMFASELADGSTVLQVRIRLAAEDGEVQLGGDPQHCGHQFRALQAFAEKDAEPVRYVRPAEAKGHGNDVWTDCSWIAAVLPLPDGPVTVLRTEAAGNPGTARWSTRPYGRFGATRDLAVTGGFPVQLDYHYVIAEGERDAAWCARTAAEVER